MKALSLVLISLLVSACSTGSYHQEHYSGRFKQFGYGFEPENSHNQHDKSNKLSPQILQKYAARIVHELGKQIDLSTVPELAIASYVEFDDNLTNTNPLGNKLVEDLMLSLREKGVRIKDINALPAIAVTPEGNFIFSRNYNQTVYSPFILSGTFVYTPNGVKVNSRLLSAHDSTIVAANSLVIPNFVVKNVFPVSQGQDIQIKD